MCTYWRAGNDWGVRGDRPGLVLIPSSLPDPCILGRGDHTLGVGLVGPGLAVVLPTGPGVRSGEMARLPATTDPAWSCRTAPTRAFNLMAPQASRGKGLPVPWRWVAGALGSG